MAAYYNEIDPNAAEGLRQLIKLGIIAPGEVDERSITEVTPDDLLGFTQCHFFAGVGVWSYALRYAGWADDRPVWTGSCPCQPFSSAGKGAGTTDDRHLWPVFNRLIQACRPPVVFGEQVTGSKIHGKLRSPRAFAKLDQEAKRQLEEDNGDAWLYLVQTDLERGGYALGHSHFPACGVGAPNKRMRCYWVAERLGDTGSSGRDQGAGEGRTGCEHEESGQERNAIRYNTSNRSAVCELADSNGERCDREQIPLRPDTSGRDEGEMPEVGRSGGSCQLADTGGSGLDGSDQPGRVEAVAAGSVGPCSGADSGLPSPVNGFWRDSDWLQCRDGKWRPAKSSIFPLAASAPTELLSSDDLSDKDVESTKEARQARLKAYGNAINAEAAKAFIEAYLEL